MTQRKTFDLYKSGVVVDLTIGTWLASTRLDQKDLGMNSLSTTYRDTLIWLGRKRLVRKGDMKALRKVVNRAMNALYYPHSFPFPFGSVQFVPFAKLPKMIETMDECEKDFWREVDLLIENYDRIREEVIVEYEVLFRRILTERIPEDGWGLPNIDAELARLLENLRNKYPSKSELKSKFRFDFTVFEVASPKFNAVTRVAAMEAVEADQVFRQRIEKKVDGFLDGVVQQLKTMAIEAVDYMAGRIDSNKVNFKTIGAFQRYVQSFKEMNFADWSIQGKMDELSRKLEVLDDTGLKDEATKRDLAGAVEDLKKQIIGTNMDEVLGTYRLLNLDADESPEA